MVKRFKSLFGRKKQEKKKEEVYVPGCNNNQPFCEYCDKSVPSPCSAAYFKYVEALNKDAEVKQQEEAKAQEPMVIPHFEEPVEEKSADTAVAEEVVEGETTVVEENAEAVTEEVESDENSEVVFDENTDVEVVLDGVEEETQPLELIDGVDETSVSDEDGEKVAEEVVEEVAATETVEEKKEGIKLIITKSGEEHGGITLATVINRA